MSLIEISHDELLKNRIFERISWDSRVSNADLHLRVNSGRVIMYGYFDKPFRHTAACETIAGTEGVLQFEDRSVVIDDYYRSDTDLEDLIWRELRQLKQGPGEWLEVNVVDGVATLDGHLKLARDKAFAARVTWELSGIKDCVNRIEIGAAAHAGEARNHVVFHNLTARLVV